MRQSPHSAFTYRPDDWHGAAAGLTGCGIAVVIAVAAIVVVFAYGLMQLALRLAAALGWGGW